MKTFRYPWFAKLVYRWANIPVSVFLLIYLAYLFNHMPNEWILAAPAFVDMAILYIMNAFYIRVWKTFPFRFQVDNEKMICKDILLRKNDLVIYHKDITELRGGVFSGSPTKPIYITDGKNNFTIGLQHHVGDLSKMLTYILSNIPKPLYNEILQNAQELRNQLRKK